MGMTTCAAQRMRAPYAALEQLVFFLFLSILRHGPLSGPLLLVRMVQHAVDLPVTVFSVERGVLIYPGGISLSGLWCFGES